MNTDNIEIDSNSHTKKTKRYESSRRENARYNKEKMTTIGIGVQHAERAVYEKSATTYGMPLSQFMRKCAIYCIRNGVDISDVDLNIEDLQD